jgi:hypothetical protein
MKHLHQHFEKAECTFQLLLRHIFAKIVGLTHLDVPVAEIIPDQRVDLFEGIVQAVLLKSSSMPASVV